MANHHNHSASPSSTAGLSIPVEIRVSAGDGDSASRLAGMMVRLGLDGILVRLEETVEEGSRCTVHFAAATSPRGSFEAVGYVQRAHSLPEGELVAIEFAAPIELAEPGLPPMSSGNGHPGAGRQSLVGLKVLVVDDEPGIVELLYRFLTRRGCEVTTATDGEHALQVLREGAREALVLDLKMPGLDGIDVLRRIRDEGLEAGTIWVISGATGQDGAREAVRLGATDFISKPVDLKYLEWSMRLYRGNLSARELGAGELIRDALTRSA